MKHDGNDEEKPIIFTHNAVLRYFIYTLSGALAMLITVIIINTVNNISSWGLCGVMLSLLVNIVLALAIILPNLRHSSIIVSRNTLSAKALGLIWRRIKLDKNTYINESPELDEFGKWFEVLKIERDGARISIPYYISNFQDLKNIIKSKCADS